MRDSGTVREKSTHQAPIAFLDVDHTLIDGSVSGFFILEAFRRRLFSPLPFLSWPLRLAAYRLGFFNAQVMDRNFSFLVGIPRSELEACAQAAFERSIHPRMRSGVPALVQRLRLEGFQVVIATSAIDILVAPLADYLGIQEVLASSMLFEDGLALGRFSGAFAFGPAKLDRARSYAEDRKIPLSSCTFYSDSIHDRPLLEAVGRPVAVNPDARLKALVRRQGWPTEDLAIPQL